MTITATQYDSAADALNHCGDDESAIILPGGFFVTSHAEIARLDQAGADFGTLHFHEASQRIVTVPSR